VRTRVCVCVYKYKCVNKYTHVCVCKMYTSLCIHVCVCVYKYECVNIYTHMCVCVCWCTQETSLAGNMGDIEEQVRIKDEIIASLEVDLKVTKVKSAKVSVCVCVCV
jgi:hypothetical protein